MNRKQLMRNRRLAHHRQGGICIWCGIVMFLPHEPEFRAYPRRQCTAEHLLPESKGGTEAAWNIAAACANCNVKHKDYTLEEWLVMVPMRLQQQGKPEHFEVCLKFLSWHANAHASANPPSGPDGTVKATVPPLTELTPAPQG